MRRHAIPRRVLESVDATWRGRIKRTGRNGWERRWRGIRIAPRGREVGIGLSWWQIRLILKLSWKMEGRHRSKV